MSGMNCVLLEYTFNCLLIMIVYVICYTEW